MKTNPKQAGMVGMVVLGGLHIVWSLLILIGAGQWLMNFSMWAHMVKTTVAVGPFNVTAAVTLIIVASLIGYGAGYAFASIWNKVHRV